MIKIDFDVVYGFGIKLSKEECKQLFPSLKYKDIEAQWYDKCSIKLPECSYIDCVEDSVSNKKNYYLAATLDFSEGYEEECLSDNIKAIQDFAKWCKNSLLRYPNFFGDANVWFD